ncbi:MULTISPECIES: wax ester/triacylglycerol synthase family O-acyltransferase [unclassified Variovorax]|uniref:WS/DGAT/MGAT family O-acyltransferase n=3 Tax=Variovorax TaxID=34072 RepID=UPI000C999C61|nr:MULTISPECIES: wax ester/triacylglycerol synthase family O-acyltransferase [unclassified Variovorax]PNG51543.1 putative diacylglycerol O-acyltransferase [Variovorax sp. B2]PNG54431.1 putative diacylglycerol O-acyltransferase [Variovorax sp. B4]VTV11935.1 Putative diacyglycerol O-acyltransferase/MT1468 [Variovorax sp. WDL1]
MHHLSGMDASFLHLETPESPMHVGSLHLIDLPPGYEGDFAEDAKKYLSGRLHLASVFVRKLAVMPFDLANPVWVDDDDLDLDHHIHHVIMPRPGTMAQLERLVGRLHSSLLDRSRPLWEMHIIEGLQTGQVALYSKMHHAAIDGQAGVAVAKALFDISDTPAPVKAPRVTRRPASSQLGMAELATAALSNAVQQYVKLIQSIPATAKAIGNVLMPVSDGSGQRKFELPKALRTAPRTPLNVSITNQRSFAARSVPLAEVKQMSKATDTSLNDIVLAICAGALRRYLADYGCRPAKPLIAGVPVSLRSEGNTDLNNQVSVMLVSLATDIADPLERLAAIHASSSEGKKLTGNVKAAIPTDFPSLGVPSLMSGLASLYGRSGLADKLPPVANVAISNVPGPSFALYFAGAKVAAYFPVSIPGHGLALNMTVQSYNGALEFGLTACRRAVPDVADLGDYVLAEHRKLFGLIVGNAQAAVAPTAVLVAAPAAAAVPKPSPKKRAAAKAAAKKKVTAKAVRTDVPKAPRKTVASKRAAALN